MSIELDNNEKAELEKTKAEPEKLRNFKMLVSRIFIQFKKLHTLEFESNPSNNITLTKEEVREILKKELFS